MPPQARPARPDPALDLVLERVIETPRRLVWKAWTEPQHLKPWFCPRPWTVTDCEIDLRPGGIFRTTMRSPEGKEFPNPGGIWLEVEPERRLVWTDALQPGYRPAEQPFMTAIITLEDAGAGTRYNATVMHPSRETLKKHEEMGFREGWGKALDQLVEYAKTMS